MDFAPEHFESSGHGAYSVLPADALPPSAYRTDLAEGSERLHGSTMRYNQGVPVFDMQEWADLTDQAAELLQTG